MGAGSVELRIDRYVGIRAAFLEIETDNGGINSLRSEAEAKAEMSEYIADFDEEDLQRLDEWFRHLETLPAADPDVPTWTRLSDFCCGDYDFSVMPIVEEGNEYGRLRGWTIGQDHLELGTAANEFLNDYFDHAPEDKGALGRRWSRR